MLPFTLPASRGYVVALSGGADSRLLLELTVRAARACAPDGDVGARVHAAHLHHGIRGASADRDEAFCRRVCDALGVPLTVEHVDIPALARESGRSEETEARLARYDFLVRTMQKVGFPALLTAHNADDQLETVLHHLLRGSGTRGMAGIPAERPLGESLADGTPLTVYRPLLSWSRRDILNALQELDLDYVTDETNQSDAYTRNRLRHRVTPLLEELFGVGTPQAAAVRLGRAAAEDDAALTAIAATCYASATAEGAAFPLSRGAAFPLSHLPPEAAIAKRVIGLAYAHHLCGDVPADRTLTAYNLDNLLTLCQEGKNGSVSDPLPGHLRAEIHSGCLTFAPCTHEDTAPPLPRPLCVGETEWDSGITVSLECSEDTLEPLTGKDIFASAVFPADRLTLPLVARTREAGDTMLSHGMTKSLKKLLCDKHIPRDLRDRIPLVCLSDGTPLWFPSVAFRDGYAPPAGVPLAGVPTVRVTVYLRDPDIL